MPSIFVGNLSYNATDHDLRSAFEQHGHVSSVQVMTDRGTGKPRGFGFVRMPNSDDAEEAIMRMNGKMICGRQISVNEANDRGSDKDRGPEPPKYPNVLELI